MEQSGDENISTYDLEETPIQEVVADAETYPFFGEKKLIYAMNPTFLSTKHKKLPFEHDLVRLEQYISNPVDYSVIVFIAPYEKLDNRKKITKVLDRKSTRLNSSHVAISYAVFCLKKKKASKV